MSAPLAETERQRLLRLRKAEHIDDYEHVVFLGYKPTRANLPTAERVAEWRREWEACNAPHSNESWRSSYARCPYCGFEAGRGVNGRLAAHSTDCPPIQFAYARNIQHGMVFGPVTLELHRYAFRTLHQLYGWDPLRERYGCLSEPARRCLRDATPTITGMAAGPNEYWLPQIMSEAIEAAEALGL